METLHEWLGYLVDGAILLFEFIGVIVVVIAGLRGIVEYGTHSPDTRLHLAKGMAMAWNSSWEARSCAPWWCGSSTKFLLWRGSSPCGRF